MKAKDTVKHADDCSWHGFMTGGALGDKKLHYECTCGREEQAEISFEAVTEELKKQIEGLRANAFSDSLFGGNEHQLKMDAMVSAYGVVLNKIKGMSDER